MASRSALSRASSSVWCASSATTSASAAPSPPAAPPPAARAGAAPPPAPPPSSARRVCSSLDRLRGAEQASVGLCAGLIGAGPDPEHSHFALHGQDGCHCWVQGGVSTGLEGLHRSASVCGTHADSRSIAVQSPERCRLAPCLTGGRAWDREPHLRRALSLAPISQSVSISSVPGLLGASPARSALHRRSSTHAGRHPVLHHPGPRGQGIQHPQAAAGSGAAPRQVRPGRGKLVLLGIGGPSCGCDTKHWHCRARVQAQRSVQHAGRRVCCSGGGAGRRAAGRAGGCSRRTLTKQALPGGADRQQRQA